MNKKKIVIAIGASIVGLFTIIIGVGMAMLQDEEIQRQVSNTNQNIMLQENEISTDRLSKLVKECTKKYTSLTVADIDSYVSSDCLIEKAETVQDCHAYKTVKIIELKNPYNPEDNRKFGSYFDGVDECVTKLAIQNHNVDACSSLDDSTVCVISYAEKFKEPERCRQATNSQDCFVSMAHTMGGYVCKMIEADKGKLDCVNDVFVPIDWGGDREPGRSALNCVLTKYPRMLDYEDYVCRIESLPLNSITIEDLLVWKTEGYGGLSICKSIGLSKDGEDGDYCLGSVAVYAKDLSLCDEVTHPYKKAMCYGTIAYTENFVTLDTCDKLEENAPCYIGVAYRLNDPSICEKTVHTNDPQQFRNECLEAIKRRNVI